MRVRVFMCMSNIFKHHYVKDLTVTCNCFSSVFHQRAEAVKRVAACALSSHRSLSTGQTLSQAALQTDALE